MYLGKPASFWLQKRNDPNGDRRGDAVAALGFIAQKHKEFIPVLAASLSDNNYEVAGTASLALSDLGPQAIPGGAVCRRLERGREEPIRQRV